MLARCVKCFLLVALLLTNSVFGEEKTITDRAVDFSHYKTYAWVSGSPAPTPTVHYGVVSTVDSELQQAGFQRTEPSTADLLIRYDFGSGMRRNACGIEAAENASGVAAPLTSSSVWDLKERVPSFTKDNICIRVLDRSKQQVVWWSIAEHSSDYSMSVLPRDPDKVVVDMFKDFPHNNK